jgi:hypothetical protein
MTAEGLLLLLMDMGVVLAPDQNGDIDYLAPDENDLSPRLRALMRAFKQQLVELLKTRYSGIPEAHPAVAPSLYRRWVTGAAPQGTFKLPSPTYHDTPSATVTYWGEPCEETVCKKHIVAGWSLRFFPSGTCVACWERWPKPSAGAPEESDPQGELYA